MGKDFKDNKTNFKQDNQEADPKTEAVVLKIDSETKTGSPAEKVVKEEIVKPKKEVVRSVKKQDASKELVYVQNVSSSPLIFSILRNGKTEQIRITGKTKTGKLYRNQIVLPLEKGLYIKNF